LRGSTSDHGNLSNRLKPILEIAAPPSAKDGSQ
jgi:hypothetical protein